jgi:AcrR family transcriptional regulator
VRRKPRLAARIPGAAAAQAGPIRAVIVDAARRLYQRRGYDAVTMRALAQDIGCSTGSLYTYFRDKEEIFAALHDEGCNLFVRWVEGVSGNDSAEALREFFRRYFEFSKAYPEFFTLLWVDHAAPRIRRDHPGLLRARSEGHMLAQKCLDEGIFSEGLTSRMITRVLWNAVQGPAVLGLIDDTGEYRAEHDQLAAAMLDVALAGLRSGAFVRAAARPVLDSDANPAARSMTLFSRNRPPTG